MRTLIVGGTGLIGRALAKSLNQDGQEVIVLTRRLRAPKDFSPGIQWLQWDGRTVEGWAALADGVDAIVNLAGENLANERWNERRKRAILQSRLDAGAALVAAVRQAARKPLVLLQASAVGYYGPNEKPLLDEDTSPGNDFLAQVCQAWEASTQPVEALGVRRVILRPGVVFSRAGGALPRMLFPFKFFVGGPLGSGCQWLSWVHLIDQVRAMRFLMETSQAAGPYNISATPLRNRQFAQYVGKVMHRPALLPVPAFVLRLVFGEMSTVVLDGQSVSAKRLTDLGFQFRFPEAEMALSDLLRSQK